MSNAHNSFKRSSHGVFIRSSHGVRGGAVFSLFAVGNFSIFSPTITGNALIDVENGTAEGLDDNATLSPAGTSKAISFNSKLNVLTPASFTGNPNEFAVFNDDTGFWEAPEFFNGDAVSFIEFEGNLVIGGSFFNVGLPAITNTNRIVKWDGTSMTSLGTTTIAGTARSLVIFGGTLYGVGLRASGSSLPELAKFNGIGWEEVTGWSPPGVVMHIGFSHAGKLYLGGTLGRFLTFDGTATVSIGVSSSSATVQSMITYKGNLIIGGSFIAVAGVSAIRLAKFDGTTWTDFAFGSPSLPGFGFVRALEIHENNLYCAFNDKIFRLNDSVEDQEVWELVIDMTGNVLDLLSF